MRAVENVQTEVAWRCGTLVRCALGKCNLRTGVGGNERKRRGRTLHPPTCVAIDLRNCQDAAMTVSSGGQ